MTAALSVITLPARLGIRVGRFALELLRGDEARPAPPPVARPEPYMPSPPHVSEGAEPVAASADPEFVEGVGAQLEIAEPWPGYDEMVVAEVVQQLAAAPLEAAAAVRLYEAAHRSRKGVLDAAERRLRGS
ncbi:MAG: hypothetical protein JW895_13575 [Thermoleophilaceae bacterium]|nr:hypothetical protein [Thermoleophilaceae bacterium]